MTVESIGNIADVYSNGKMPQRGRYTGTFARVEK